MDTEKKLWHKITVKANIEFSFYLKRGEAATTEEAKEKAEQRDLHGELLGCIEDTPEKLVFSGTEITAHEGTLDFERD